MSLEISGTLYKKYDTKTVGKNNDFQVREFIIKTDGQYPQYPTLQVTKENCRVLESIDNGDAITCQINVRGNLYNDKKTGEEKSFTSIEAWKVEYTAIQTDGTLEGKAKSVSEKAAFIDEEDSDLPF